jgi:Flp pilus assembly protein TadD
MKGNVRIAAVTIAVLLLAALVLGLVSCITFRTSENGREIEPSKERRYPITDEARKRVITSSRPSQDSRDSLYNNACYFQRRGKHKLAIEEFKRALAIDPNYANAYNGIGVSYDFLGDYSSAIDAYEKALALNPDLDYVYNNLGYCYLLKGKLNYAIAAFRKAISFNEQNKLYHNNLGLAYAERGDTELALIELKLAGDAARAQYILGQICYQKGSYVQAEEYLTKAIANDPSLTNAERYLKAASTLAKISRVQHEQEPDMATGPGHEDNKPVLRSENHALVVGTNAAQHADHKIAGSLRLSRNETEIEVSNGNGVRHMAKRVGAYLSSRGFVRIRLTNARHFNYTTSRIYYRDGYLTEAATVGQNLPAYGSMREVKALSKPGTKVRVLVGKDLISHIEGIGNGA